MRLLHVAAMLLTELGVGTLLVTAIFAPRLMPTPFFSFNSLLSAVLAGTGLLLLRISLPAGWTDARFLGLVVIGATVAYGCYRLDRRDAGRFFLIVTGLAGLLFGLLPMADRTLRAWQVTTTVPYIFAASSLTGTALLGITFVAMFYAQWHGIVRGGFHELLRRLTLAILIAVGVRACLLLGTVASLSRLDPTLGPRFVSTLWVDDPVLFAFRVALGVVIPSLLAWQALTAVTEHADPPPTGKFAFLFLSVIGGEFLAAKLLI